MAKARILIVEDEPNIVESLSFILRRAGFEVDTVTDGAEALDRVRRQAFSALILDIMLPGMNGFDVLQAIRADHALAALPVMVLTAKGQADDRRTAEAVGASAFITKPFSNAEVVEHVSRLAGGAAEMRRSEADAQRARDAATLLPVAAAVLLLPPFILVFAAPVLIAGIPLIVVYVFGVWAAVVLVRMVVARRHRSRCRIPRAMRTHARGGTASRHEPGPALMLHANLVVFVCLAYVAILFGVAFAGDRRARRDPTGWLSSPLVYTLSISIYCTSWTFFGAVGSAATSGMEFVTIYLGPTIVFAGWWVFLRKLVTVGRVHHTTSIADLISARFGKNPALGAIVTLMALVATAPYIALQLKALTASFQVVTFPAGAVVAAGTSLAPDYGVAFWLAAGLCVFSIMFGVRNIDVNERHHGVIAAIAVEAVVKLVALLAVGLWVVFGLAGTSADVFANAPVSLLNPEADVRRALGDALLPRRRRGDLPAAPVPGHRRRELQRAPDPDRVLAVPALSCS